MKLSQRISIVSFSFLVLFTLSSVSANAQNNLQCIGSDGRALSQNNNQVLAWKRSTPDQFKDRGLVQGIVVKIYPDQTGHTHFAIDLDNDASGDLEVIYNDDFGELPVIQIGMKVIACGDYITVSAAARRPSPMGAIIHWVHYNPGDRDGGKHPHGFLIIGGKPYGFSAKK